MGFSEKVKKAVGIEGGFRDTIMPMVGYNSASILFGGAGHIISLYFMSFLTEVEGLNTRQAGLVILFGLVWDAVTDPAMGLITDRTRSRFGRHRLYILLGIAPVALSYFMLWNSFGLSKLGNDGATMTYYIIAYMFFSTAMTIVAVPHTAMLPELAPKYFLRTQYKSVEYLVNSVGMTSSFVLASLIFGYVNMDTLTADTRPRFALMGGILCLFFALPLIFTFTSTREPSSKNMPLIPLDLKGFFNEYIQVFRNKAFRRYFFISLFFMMCRGFYNYSNQFFIRYIAKRWNRYNIITTVAGISEASAFPLNYWLTKKYGKQFCGKLLTPVVIGGLALNLFITPSSPSFLVYLAVIMFNFGFSGVGFVATNIQPDVTDVDEMITGRRREGVIATFSSLIKKTVSGLMGSMTGFTLSAFGFVTGKGENVTQTPRAIRGLRLTYSVLPILFITMSALTVFLYDMTKKDHEMIKAAIREKKINGFASMTQEQKAVCERIAGHRFEDMWIGSEQPAAAVPQEQ
ncbi:MAG TPA: MFS transporter [Clostridiales bacterium]|nr:MAG: Melibiose carrier protein [Firmicutes bacterium ADurb.Bin262]HOU09840.1 MFS transporter [Clostridiales bacterium]HQH62363.1 MFS transporter [Clostridiales bacterium]HQK72634.1 MFS transporter [Clostridiales bacterium]